MKKVMILVAILLMAIISLNSQIANAYLTNMVNGAQQDTITVLTTAENQCFVTFDIENPGVEPIVLNAVNFSCWSYNLGNWDQIGPNIGFTLYSNEGQWNANDNCINNLYFVDLGIVINPGNSKTFVVMGDIWSTSNGGSKFSLGLSGNGNFNIIGQTSGDVYMVNMIGPNWDNIFHIINLYQPMHRFVVYPQRDPQEIYPYYFQDHFFTYAGQRFWNNVFISKNYNAVENSMVTISGNTYFGGSPGQLIINNLSINQYNLSGLMYNWQPQYSSLQTSWLSPDTLGVDQCWFYMNQVECHVSPNFTQSEYMTANIGNYTPLIGMQSEGTCYERVYHGYEAIKFDVDGNGLAEPADALMWQQYDIGALDLSDTQFNDNSSPNISRVCIYYPYGNNFDAWIGNLWTLNNDIDIAQNLRINLPYDGTWPGETNISYTISENTITADTDGNCVGIFGNLPDGTPWNTIIFMNGSENLRWSSERRTIEPERIQINREEIQIQIPEGLTNIDVQARNVNQYTPNSDSIIPVANVPFLNQNSPNPFNPSTSISYSLPKAGAVTIDVYNSKGQLIRNLINEAKASGNHSIAWNGTDNNGKHVSSGIYFYKMQADKYSASKKMILMK